MPRLCLAFVILRLPHSPPMTSAPLGMVCPYPAAFPGPRSPDSNLQCAEMAVYLLVLIKGSSLCDLCYWVMQSPLALPLFSPISRSLLGFSVYHYGKPIWDDTHICYFSHPPIFQLGFWASSRVVNGVPSPATQVLWWIKCQEFCLFLAIPAFNYGSLLPLLPFELLPYQKEAPFIPSMSLSHALLYLLGLNPSHFPAVWSGPHDSF